MGTWRRAGLLVLVSIPEVECCPCVVSRGTRGAGLAECVCLTFHALSPWRVKEVRGSLTGTGTPLARDLERRPGASAVKQDPLCSVWRRGPAMRDGDHPPTSLLFPRPLRMQFPEGSSVPGPLVVLLPSHHLLLPFLLCRPRTATHRNPSPHLREPSLLKVAIHALSPP